MTAATRALPPFPDDKPLVVFDGYCGLCSRTVQFILRHDHRGVFRFLAAQTGLGSAIYRHYGLSPDNYETFILISGGRAFFASDAAIELSRHLSFPWSMAVVGRLVPRSWRDGLYFLIARNRMRFFGRSAACYLPSPETASRFLAGDLGDYATNAPSDLQQ
jgi:predicted DCC family thiol-disulfide oxidoreductase YuxK